MVLFLCRNKSSRNGTKLCEDSYIIKENFWSQQTPKGGTWVGPTHKGTPAPQARPGGLSLPCGPADPEADTINPIFQKKIRGKNYRDPRDGAAVTSSSSLGGQIWSPFGAPKRGIFVLRHRQPFSIAYSKMLPTRSGRRALVGCAHPGGPLR